MYSSARAEFCAERSCSFCFETDFGLCEEEEEVVVAVSDDVADSEVIVFEEASSDDISIPSIELDDVEASDTPAGLLARFIRNDLQSPNESSSM